MKEMKVIIGANFGDEGKGLMTDYFANKSINANKKTLVVCTNGGSQRSHTVETADGTFRHAFRHIGSGTLAGADTYLLDTFLINPIIFKHEQIVLSTEPYAKQFQFTQVWVHEDCRITFPFDMMINQMLESRRDLDRHGSCGLGIQETILRNNSKEFAVTYQEFLAMSTTDRKRKMMSIIRNYASLRVKDLEIQMTKQEKENLFSEEIIDTYLEDFEFFATHTKIIKKSQEKQLIDTYDTIIFENGQGLLLDKHNMDYYPHLTPTNTGTRILLPFLEKYQGLFELELCYVSRTYLTRHGAGRMDGEFSETERKNYHFIDKTNTPNEYQGTMRFGELDTKSLLDRIMQDIRILKNHTQYRVYYSLAMTHCNYINTLGNQAAVDEIESHFHTVYESYKPYDVIKKKPTQ